MFSASPVSADPVLAHRLRQQALVVEFGLYAFRCRELDALLDKASRLAAQGVGTRLAKVLQYMPAEKRFLVRAGVGWGPGVVGHATIGGDAESPAGRALATGEPVISNALHADERFRTSALLLEHGVDCAVNVLIADDDGAFGVLEADSQAEGRFSEEDVAFLQGLANLLAVAIGRIRADAALRASEERARRLIEGLRDHAVFTLDAAGRVTAWSGGARELLLYAEDEIVGRDGAAIFTEQDRAAGVPAAELLAARERGSAEDERWHLCKDGTMFWGSGSTRALRDEAGSVIGFIKILTDRTHQREAGEVLRRMNETLEARVAQRTAELQRSEAALRQAQRMEAVGKSAGIIAHDFNNVLQAVIGYLALLGQRVAADAKSARFVASALAAAERGESLTRQLLDFSRQQSSTRPEMVDVNAALAGIDDLVRRSVGDGITLVRKVARGLPPVVVDLSQLERAVLNLAINARDAMPDGGTLTIETRVVGSDDLSPDEAEGIVARRIVRIAVRDTGAGMPPEVRERAFEPFFSTKPSGTGSGLGLSMVYGFARQAGGRVRIETGAGCGTTVTLFLPAVPPRRRTRRPG